MVTWKLSMLFASSRSADVSQKLGEDDGRHDGGDRESASVLVWTAH